MAIRGEQSAVQRVAFGAEALGHSEVADMGGVENGNGKTGGVKRGDDRAFVAASALADDMDGRAGLGQHQEFFMAARRVGQGVLTIQQMELEGRLGDVKAGIDWRGGFKHNRASCSAHSCTYERVV